MHLLLIHDLLSIQLSFLKSLSKEIKSFTTKILDIF